MTKADIVDVISSSLGLTKKDTEEVVNGFLQTVSESMERGETIELRGFGVFKVVERAARKARNPKTNVEVHLPPQNVPTFKFSKEIKESVKNTQS
ncbi:MAG: HU family DNA-binding protein [Balneolaceae bacterium]|nr:HU family DNA-binding protein [Balneolaceae bacterium]MDR9446264.1 HU family DNA-binding protein [Balneolaceae bacterium]